MKMFLRLFVYGNELNGSWWKKNLAIHLLPFVFLLSLWMRQTLFFYALDIDSYI